MRRSLLWLALLPASLFFACSDSGTSTDVKPNPAGTGGVSSGGKAGAPTAGKGGASAGKGGSAGQATTGGAGGSAGSATEDTDELCNDGKDNDGDGFIDCGDPNCTENPTVTICGPAAGSGGANPFGGNSGGESTPAACSDNSDNDGDDFIDCDDKDCCSVVDCSNDAGTYCAKQGAGGSSGAKENTPELCQDGVNNDGDKFTDCDDFDCCSIVDCKLIAPTSSCAKQNSGSENTVTLCTDNKDNNGNGFVDCEDKSCCDVVTCPKGTYCGGGSGGSGGSTGGKENTADLCQDGLNNDGDKYTDCEDSDCCKVVDCKSIDPTSFCGKQGTGGAGGSSGGSENTVALCTDKQDNDGDSFVDCEDKDCCSLLDCKATAPTSYCAKQGAGGAGGSSGGGENTVALCTDKQDNDGDKFIDCEDKDCCALLDCKATAPTSYCAKQGAGGAGGSSGGGESTVALCTDKMDNDGDSFVDCEDKDCCSLLDCKATAPTSYCAKQGVENTVALCTDKQDNDGDKFIDCEDKDCCALLDCKATAPTSFCGKM